MIRTSIIPNEQNISITIPQNYVGKKIEVLLYAIEELHDEEKPLVSSGAANFKNIFSMEEGKDFNSYITQARTEWDRDI